MLLTGEMLIRQSSHCRNCQRNDMRSGTVCLLCCRVSITLHRMLDSCLPSAQKRHKSFCQLPEEASLHPRPFPLTMMLPLSFSRSLCYLLKQLKEPRINVPDEICGLIRRRMISWQVYLDLALATGRRYCSVQTISSTNGPP